MTSLAPPTTLGPSPVRPDDHPADHPFDEVAYRIPVPPPHPADLSGWTAHMSAPQLLAMLNAYRAISAYSDFDDLLERVATAARTLVGARTWDLHLAAELTTGPLCAVLESARPVRLPARLLGGPATAHGDVLAVALRVGERLFGVATLTGPPSHRFSDDHVSLLLALSEAAAAALETAEVHDTIRRTQSWLAAAGDLTRDLIVDDPAVVLPRIARTASRLADAGQALILRKDGDELHIIDSTGWHRGLRFPLDSPLGAMVAAGEPVAVSSAAELPITGRRDRMPGPVLIAPMTGKTGVCGALVLSREHRCTPFSPAEVEMARILAQHLALALELTELRADAERARLLDERARIGRELQDVVMERLFVIGFGLTNTTKVVRSAESARRLANYIADLDETISTIRSTIVALRFSGFGGRRIGFSAA